MKPSDVKAILLRWWRLTAAYLVAGIGGALLLGLLTTPVYQASTTIVVTQDEPGMSANLYSDVLTGERLASTYSRMLNSRPLLERALANLGIDMDSRELRKRFTVKLVPGTHLIVVAVEDTDAGRAVAILNGITKEFAGDIRDQRAKRYSVLTRRLHGELDRVTSDLEGTRVQLAQLAGKDSPEDLEAKSRMAASITQAQANFDSLQKSALVADLAEARTGGSMVAAEAQASSRPVRPRIPGSMLMAGLLALLVSVCVAALVEKLDDSIDTAADLAGAVGAPILGMVPGLGERVPGGRQAGSAAPPRRSPVPALARPNSAAGEAFRVLQTNLEFAKLSGPGGQGMPLHVLLVTSAHAGEGKSTVAANLAVLMAQRGKQVILVDANLRAPTLHNYFGISNAAGLTTALLSPQVPAGQYLAACGVGRLLLLPSGPLPPNPADLLQSRRMADLVRQLASLASDGLVIVDSPDILGGSDATSLASICDGALLVTEAGSTRAGALKKAVATAFRAFDSSRASRPGGGRRHLLGVVLNGLSSDRQDGYYYDYNGYNSAGESGAKRHNSIRAMPRVSQRSGL